MERIESKFVNELYNEIEKAGYLTEGYYCKYNNEDLSLSDFVESFLKNKNITDYIITSTDAYESLAYDCEVLSVTWIEKGILQLETFLIESM
jgi:hypothetical protein